MGYIYWLEHISVFIQDSVLSTFQSIFEVRNWIVNQSAWAVAYLKDNSINQKLISSFTDVLRDIDVDILSFWSYVKFLRNPNIIQLCAFVSWMRVHAYYYKIWYTFGLSKRLNHIKPNHCIYQNSMTAENHNLNYILILCQGLHFVLGLS